MLSKTPEHHRPHYGMGVCRAIDEGTLVIHLEREGKEGIVLEDLRWTDKRGQTLWVHAGDSSAARVKAIRQAYPWLAKPCA
jgi:hypothetical protein